MSDADAWHALAAFTPARVALGRTGNALSTRRVLEFQLAHARARDAVHTPFDAKNVARALNRFGAVQLTTQAADRQSYLMNPVSGRHLAKASRGTLKRGTFDAALAIVDGLSATAIHQHGAALAIRRWLLG